MSKIITKIIIRKSILTLLLYIYHIKDNESMLCSFPHLLLLLKFTK